jgi:two-component system cell cycle sensor histidine kinase/response regulator CckA
LAKSICEARPAIKVLFLSGYTDDIINRQAECPQDIRFLQKPFTPAQLVQEVWELLFPPTTL